MQTMADNWRRFVLPTQTFPHCMFHLLNCEEDETFIDEYKRLRSILEVCPQCVDLEFSTILLQFVNLNASDEEIVCSVKQLRRFLLDISIVAPLSSDLVECMHGFTQTLLHRFRGSKPSEMVAQERVMWKTITKGFATFQKWLWNRYGDASSGRRMHRFGRASRNQYSHSMAGAVRGKGTIIPVPDTQCNLPANDVCKSQKRPRQGMSMERVKRLFEFGQEESLPMPRKLSGAWACERNANVSNLFAKGEKPQVDQTLD